MTGGRAVAPVSGSVCGAVCLRDQNLAVDGEQRQMQGQNAPAGASAGADGPCGIRMTGGHERH